MGKTSNFVHVYRAYRQSKYVIVLNLGTENNLIDLHSNIDDLPATLNVVAASPNSGYTKGYEIYSF